MKVTLVLHNIRSIYNVGAILRTAECFGVEKVVVSGYTPWYKKPDLLPHLAEKLERQITKTAVGADKMVTVEWVEDLGLWLSYLPESIQKLGLENRVKDIRLDTIASYLTNELTRELRFLAKGGMPADFDNEKVLVLGEEVEGIPADIIQKMDVLLEIPMCGQKESLNVSVAAGIALYELSKHI